MHFLKSSRLERRLKDTSARSFFGVSNKVQAAPEDDDHRTPVKKGEYIENLRKLQGKTKDSELAHHVEKEIQFIKKT